MTYNSTISNKEKPCKGIGRAKDYGCGKKVLERTYGLGWCCYYDWLLTSEEGKKQLSKLCIKQKKDREEREQKEWKKEKKELKKETHKSNYKGYLQDQINLLCRKIDNYCMYNCIDCKEPLLSTVDAAHYHSIGSNATLKYNLHNIHSATKRCNWFSEKHITGYKEGLEKRYGEKYMEYVVNELPLKYPHLKLTGVEVYEKLTLVRKINREFEKQTNLFTNLNGKEIREYYNNLIGIYK